MDIYQFAMQMEMEGREHYLKMAAMMPGGSGERIFRILADEELRHYEYIKKLAESGKVAVESDNVQAAENEFYSMLGKEEFTGYTLPIDSYSMGILLEDKSIAFYREKAMKETNQPARVLFLKLYFEEKKHKLLLENILEMILEPERRLESPELERPLKQDI